MAKRLKKIAIFYRSLPAVLEHHVLKDKEMSLLKDGIFTHDGVRCPRATIAIEWDGSKAAQERLERLVRLLEELEKNNQIATFTVRN